MPELFKRTMYRGDTIGFNVRFGADGTGTNLFSSPIVAVSDTTISSFNDNTTSANDRMYFYFTQLSATLIRAEFIIYWNDL